MKKLTWDEYYYEFYNWSPSTQKNYSYRLSDFGSAEEVFEVANEFAFNDEKFACRFIEKALEAGVRFTPEQILEMIYFVEKPLLGKISERASTNFTREQLEEIYLSIDDASFERISKKAGIDIFDDVIPANDFISPPQKKPGFFSTLFAVIAGVSLANNSKQHRHNGRCNGNCAHCPPHYGYRYGRWYYGHNHVHGCEFGGNKGSGGMD